MLKIDWESVYDGTIKPMSTGTDMFGDQTGAFDLAIALNAQKMNKKFDLPIKPIPWSTEYEENVLYTLEWLLRDHRKDEIRLDEDDIVEHIKDFWYRSVHFETGYTHVCYPKEMLSYRTQYESYYAQLVNLSPSAMSSYCLPMRARLRDYLWTAWKCTGMDGKFNKFDGNGVQYNYACSRCGSPIPKAIKAFIKLQALQKKVSDEPPL